MSAAKSVVSLRLDGIRQTLNGSKGCEHIRPSGKAYPDQNPLH
jgi:hypothetical protein